MDFAMTGSWLTDTEAYINTDGVLCYCNTRGRAHHLEPSWSYSATADFSPHLIIAPTWLDTAIDFGHSKQDNHEQEYLRVADNLLHISSNNEHVSSMLDTPGSRILFTLCLDTPFAAGYSDEGRRGVLESLMEEVYNIFDCSIILKTIDGIGSTASAAPSTTSSSTMAKTSRSLGPKRAAKDQPKEEFIEENKDRVKRPKTLAARPAYQRHLNFACPYRKHNPRKYGLNTSWVSCALSPWQNVSRVKEHLYRNHQVPPHCKRCWLLFDSEAELQSHIAQDHNLICEVKPGRAPDGITKETMGILRSRKKSHPGQSEESRWREIYCTLFPEDDIVPSPYFEPVQDAVAQPLDLVSLNDFATYSRRETPRLIRSILENESEHDQLVSETRIASIIQSFQERLMSEYISQVPTENPAYNEVYVPSTNTETISTPSLPSSITGSSRFDMLQLDQTVQYSHSNVTDEYSWDITGDLPFVFSEELDTLLGSFPDFPGEEHLK